MRAAPPEANPSVVSTTTPLLTSSFWLRIGLQPYGDHLCAPDAKRWIAFVTVLILLLAGIDATVWAYVFASLATSRVLQIIVGIITWLLIFRVVTMFDAWMVTLDRSRGIYDLAARTLGDEIKYYVMFTLRIAMVGIVFLAAGP